MLVDWKIEQGDVVIQGGDAVLVTGLDAVRQEIVLRLETQALEWIFDTRIGLDFFDLMQSDETDLVTIRAGLIAQLVLVPDVERVVYADVRIEGVRLLMRFVVLVNTGDGTVETLSFEAATQTDDFGELMLLVYPTTGIAP